MSRQWLERMPAPVAGAIVVGLLVLCVLFQPPQEISRYVSGTDSDYSVENHYPPETWAAIAAAIFAGILALAAVVQIRDSRRSAERQYRAYVLIDTAEFGVPKTENGDNEPWYVHVAFKNFGQTPAHFAVVKAMIAVGAPKPLDVSLILTGDATTYSEATIPPGHTHTIRMRCLDHGAADYLAHRAAGRHAYVWGRIDYTDIFGAQNFTQFQMIQIFGQVHQFAFCKEGNRTEARRPAPAADGQGQ